MKALNPSTGNLETVYVKALDSMPVGTEVDFDGTSADIPTGWEQVASYSTNEIKTGDTWIDGKPIYRKVLNITSFSSQNTQISHGISNISDVVNIYGSAKLNDGRWQPIPRVVTDNISSYGIGIGDITPTQILLQVPTYYTTRTKAYIIIEYTKTTD